MYDCKVANHFSSLVASALSTSCLNFNFFRYDVGNLNYTIPNFLTGLLTDLNFSITDVSNLQLTLDEMAKWVNSLSDNALLNVMVVFGLPILTAGLTGNILKGYFKRITEA